MRALLPEAPHHAPLPPDWPTAKRARVITHLDVQHGLAGWVYKQLCAIDPQEDWFERTALGTAERQRRKIAMTRIRQSLLFQSELKNAGVAFGVFKGDALSTQLFDDPVLRHAKDSDIYVPEKNFKAALGVAKDFGADVAFDYNTVSSNRLTSLLRTQKDIELFLPDGCLVELHARPLFLRSLSAPIEWKADADGVMHIPRADQFYYLLCHGQMASWVRLKWTLDVFLLAKTMKPTDWERVSDMSRSANCISSLKTGLEWIDHLFGCQYAQNLNASPNRLGRSQKQRLAALDRFDARMDHRDNLFFTSKLSDRFMAFRGLYLNAGVAKMNKHANPISNSWVIIAGIIQRLLRYVRARASKRQHLTNLET